MLLISLSIKKADARVRMHEFCLVPGFTEEQEGSITDMHLH